MTDEILGTDDINLDDFNFDDLPSLDDEQVSAMENAELSSKEEILSADFSFDDVLSGEGESTFFNAEETGREEPFFEAKMEAEESEISVVNDTEWQKEDVVEPEAAEDNEDVAEPEVIAESEPDNAMEFETDFDAENKIQNETDFDANDEMNFANEEIASTEEKESDIEQDGMEELPVTEDGEIEKDAWLEQEFPNIDANEEKSEIQEDLVTEKSPFLAEGSVENELEPEAEIIAEEIDEGHEEYFDSDVSETEVFADKLVYGAPSGEYPAVEETENIGYLRWYDGMSADEVFSIGRGFESGTFNATEECKTLHVNVGYDTYGWEVQFSDGVVMNLRDVREYQIRNGRLPVMDGRIIYGQSVLMFSGVEKIVVYESVKYFAYGV